MNREKKTDIVDDFISRLRGNPALQGEPWPKRIDDLDAVLQLLFVSDNDRAIEMFDEIRGVIERKHLTMEKRITIIQKILRAGSIHLP
jgi:hypothetical protein